VNDQELDLMHALKNSTKAATSTQDLSAPNKQKILQKVKLFEDQFYAAQREDTYAYFWYHLVT